jgi:very-short-patch-repair endonuclease
VSTEQLTRIGFSQDSIERRVRSGRLRRLHRGVYLVGPIRPPHAREMAAVLACGPSAVLSHRSAGALWNLLPCSANSGPVHVTVPGAERRRTGIRIHRVGELSRDEIRRHHGIPVTAPERTILDLAADVTPAELEQALATAERSHLTTCSKLYSLLARYPGRPGTPLLRKILERNTRPALTRSQAERRLLNLIRNAGLPGPEVNFKAERYELDLYWPEHRFAVEVDALWTHGSAASFEADRRRDAELAADGIQVMRVTDRGIADEPERQVALIAQALARRAP